MRPQGAALGLGTGQPKLIDYLARSGPCSQKQLADYFEIDPAAVCRMLDALEKGGFVTRTAGRTDRRSRLPPGQRSGCWQGFPQKSGRSLPIICAAPTAT